MFNHRPVALLVVFLSSVVACVAEPTVTCGPGTLDRGDTCIAAEGSGSRDARGGRAGAGGGAGHGGTKATGGTAAAPTGTSGASSNQAGTSSSGGSSIGGGGSANAGAGSGLGTAGAGVKPGGAAGSGGGAAGSGGTASGGGLAAGTGGSSAGQGGSAPGGGGGGAKTSEASVCGQAKENENVALACPAGQVITAITFASFGTPTGTCGSLAVGGCHATESQANVAAACVGKTACTVAANNATFGDPCFGTEKVLRVQAACAPGTGTAGSGGTAGAGGTGGGTTGCECFTCPGTPPTLSRSFAEGDLIVTASGSAITAHYFEGILYAKAAWPGDCANNGGCAIDGVPTLYNAMKDNGYGAVDDALSFAQGDPLKGWKPPPLQAKTYCDGQIIEGCMFPVQVRVDEGKGYLRLLKPNEVEWHVDGGWLVNTSCGPRYHDRCFVGVASDEQLGLGAPKTCP